jgi:hypothetical protein
MDEQLTASSQSAKQGSDRSIVIGARRIDDDVGGLCRLRQTFPIIQRSQQRLDASGTNRIGLFLGANQAGYVMSGGNEMSCNRSADIAGGACAEDFHPNPSGDHCRTRCD